jgi:hypothetical protein
VVVLRTTRILLLASLSVCWAATAGAQTDSRNELTVFGGLSLIDLTSRSAISPFPLAVDAELLPLVFPPIGGRVTKRFDGGAEFGVRYGRDVNDALTMTGDFSIVPGHEFRVLTRSFCPDASVCIARPTLSQFVADYFLAERFTAYHYGGGFRWNVLRTDLGSGTLTPAVIAGLGGVTFAGMRQTESAVTFRIGAGLTASYRRLTAGVEAVDVIESDHFVTGGAENDVHFRLTFGVRF